MIGCEKNTGERAIIVTGELCELSPEHARVKGYLFDLDGIVEEYGHCWSRSPEPSITDEVVQTDTLNEEGAYISELTGLLDFRDYYVRAYMIIDGETVYGEEITFNSGMLFDKRDGRLYETVRISTQVWMAQNMAYLPKVTPSDKGSLSSPYYYVYGYEGNGVPTARGTAKYKKFGVLYNWPAAVREACPEGWHLPGEGEWLNLLKYVYDSGNSDALGKALKSKSGWQSFGNGTDEHGFSALPGGALFYDPFEFLNAGYIGVWWSKTKIPNSGAIFFFMQYDNDLVKEGVYPTAGGFSVRCIRNK